MEESRSVIQRWIKAGQVTINDRQCKASQRLRAADEIAVKPLPPPAMDLVPENLPLSIVFEDEFLVVVDKPAGMVVHPGAGNYTGTLVNALLYHFERISRQDTIRPGIVHRLDKDTSGLLVVAKTDRAHDHLARQFKERLVTKLYLCLVHGCVESDRGEIDLPVGRHSTRRTRMSTHSRTPRSALTGYRVVRRFFRVLVSGSETSHRADSSNQSVIWSISVIPLWETRCTVPTGNRSKETHCPAA